MGPVAKVPQQLCSVSVARCSPPPPGPALQFTKGVAYLPHGVMQVLLEFTHTKGFVSFLAKAKLYYVILHF